MHECAALSADTHTHTHTHTHCSMFCQDRSFSTNTHIGYPHTHRREKKTERHAQTSSTQADGVQVVVFTFRHMQIAHEATPLQCLLLPFFVCVCLPSLWPARPSAPLFPPFHSSPPCNTRSSPLSSFSPLSSPPLPVSTPLSDARTPRAHRSIYGDRRGGPTSCQSQGASQ